MSKKIYRNILFTALAVFACSMVSILTGSSRKDCKVSWKWPRQGRKSSEQNI